MTSMASALSLLTQAERALRAGRPEKALGIFRQIAELHSGTLESVAALAYLRNARRRPPRRAEKSHGSSIEH